MTGRCPRGAQGGRLTRLVIHTHSAAQARPAPARPATRAVSSLSASLSPIAAERLTSVRVAAAGAGGRSPGDHQRQTTQGPFSGAAGGVPGARREWASHEGGGAPFPAAAAGAPLRPGRPRGAGGRGSGASAGCPGPRSSEAARRPCRPHGRGVGARTCRPLGHGPRCPPGSLPVSVWRARAWHGRCRGRRGGNRRALSRGRPAGDPWRTPRGPRSLVTSSFARRRVCTSSPRDRVAEADVCSRRRQRPARARGCPSWSSRAPSPSTFVPESRHPAPRPPVANSPIGLDPPSPLVSDSGPPHSAVARNALPVSRGACSERSARRGGRLTSRSCVPRVRGQAGRRPHVPVASHGAHGGAARRELLGVAGVGFLVCEVGGDRAVATSGH